MFSGVFVNFNGTSILQLMSFFLLMYLLIKYLYKPFLNLVDQRKRDVKAEYDKVESARKEAEELKKKSEAEFKNLNEKINTMYEEAKERVKKYEETEKNRVQAEISNMLDKARKEIAEEQSKAEEALRAKVVTLAIALASKVIQKDLDDKSKREFLMNQLSKFGGKK
jgi:F-type H+-transporting ATPase subunit b